MKKKILLFTLSAGIISLSLSSYDAGPAHSLGNTGGNRTGGPGSNNQTCADVGCHAAKSSSTAVSIKLKDVGTGQFVTDNKYKPLRTYDVEVTVSNPSFTKFGFQAEVLNSANNNIGVINAGLESHTVTVSGKTLVEHHTKISGTTTHFTWVSPAAGAGTATFYVEGNAVNGNGSAGDDVPSNPFSAAFTENNTSVDDVNQHISVSAYPNPIQGNILQVELTNVSVGEYIANAFDMSGRKLAEEKFTITNTAEPGKIKFNTSNWAAGLYHIQVIKDGLKYVTPVVKY